MATVSIGQIRKSSSTEYCTTLYTTSQIVQIPNGDSVFNETGVFFFTDSDKTTSAKLNADTSYYLRGSVLNRDNKNGRTVTLSVRLYDSADVSSYQLIKKEIYLAEGESTDFEFLFSPIATFDTVVFVINRNYSDTSSPRTNVGVTVEDAGIINNILPSGIVATQIGFQSRPSTLLQVNNEAIRVGRSGIFEINNGVKVTSVGVAAPGCSSEGAAAIDFFLLDYTYEN